VVCADGLHCSGLNGGEAHGASGADTCHESDWKVPQLEQGHIDEMIAEDAEYGWASLLRCPSGMSAIRCEASLAPGSCPRP